MDKNTRNRDIKLKTGDSHVARQTRQEMRKQL